MKFFFLLTFAAAIPAIISGGLAERTRFYPQLAAINSLMAMVGGILAALVTGKNDPGFVHSGPLAGWWPSVPVPISCIHLVR